MVPVKKNTASGAALLALVVFLLLGGIMLLGHFGFLTEKRLGLDENPYLAAVVLQLLIYAVPALFYCRIRGSAFRARLRLSFAGPGQILFLLYAAVFLICGSALASVGMYSLFPNAFAVGGAETYTAFARTAGIFDGLYLVLAFAVLPAVTEEFLFRGILLAAYENLGVSCAVLVTSMTFAMSHFSFARFPVYLFGGLVLCAVTYTTRSLPAAMLVHACHNAFVLFLEKYILHIAEKQSVSMVLFLMIAGFLTLTAGLLMSHEAANLYAGYADRNLPADYLTKKRPLFPTLAQSLFSPLYLTMVVIYVTATVVVTTGG